ncbi:DUF551 domain-containing protein [Caldimonas tepidiphila]|uniref:DUF551 domain-containing protein n=1 Tax=Caldimonas tepidiphila TaxID=2315841 RepID=UPI000E5A1D36|nr:DUF551 domain-containing protein [Caldimonas tepidiphila]
MTTETITWHPVAERLPDDDTTVLLAVECDDEPTWPGFHSEGGWYYVSGARVAARVTHWADMPGGPKG